MGFKPVFSDVSEDGVSGYTAGALQSSLKQSVGKKWVKIVNICKGSDSRFSFLSFLVLEIAPEHELE